MDLTATIAAQDSRFRAIALRMDRDWGEDAYHQVVLSLWRRPITSIRDPQAFLIGCIKNQIRKMYRDEWAHAVANVAYLADAPPPHAAHLALGRVRRTHCRRGHPLEEPNLTRVAGRRTCLWCFREGAKRRARTYRARRQVRSLERTKEAACAA